MTPKATKHAGLPPMASRFVEVAGLPWESTRFAGVQMKTLLVDNGVVSDGDLIVLTIGEPIGKSGGTNTMKIVKVGEHRRA